MGDGSFIVADPAFRSIQTGYTGFRVWRIEQLELVPVPKEKQGTFFNGDSYIIYSAVEYGKPGGPSVKDKPCQGSRLEQHIHFWLGAECSQDEAAVAAYKSVELDEFLEGSPVQHREVQGHESPQFLAYFKDGLRIMQGGVASGMNHVTEDLSPKLYLVKGKRQPIIRQLTDVAWGAMNDGDAFVLDVANASGAIFAWSGKGANRLEKLQASKLALKLKDEAGKGEVIVVEDGRESALTDEERVAFEAHLPLGQKNSLKDGSKAESDEKEDARVRKEIKLYRCSDEDGKLKISEVKTGPLLQKDLVSDDSFIVDNGNAGIWVWVGRRASKKERTEAMRNAQGFIKKKNYNAYTQVTRVVDQGEPAEFKALFKGWKDKDASTGFGKTYTASRGVANIVQTKFDAETLHSNPAVAANTRMVDDGKGAKEVFRVDNFDLLQVEGADEGKFYSGDCYVILYAYNVGGRDCYLIYYWLGGHSTADEQGTAALKAVELDDRLGGQPIQVRVIQGKEPPHFLAMFGGKFTVLQGGISSKFEGGEREVSNSGSQMLLQVHGRTELSTKAVEVDFTSASLNTNDCFVLVDEDSKVAYTWLGKGSTGDEREMAKNIANNYNAEPDVVYEGQEKNDFWSLIGGKKPYFDERIVKEAGEEFAPRLFHGTNATGNFKLEEILDFSQMDLVLEDVMLLDVGDTVFIWLGRMSNDTERKSCVVSAQEYLETDPSGRDSDIPIIVVKQGFEPPHFTGFFGAWDPNLRGDDEAEIGQMSVVGVDIGRDGGLPANMQSPKVALDRLKSSPGASDLPDGVDPARREDYLSDSEFEAVFGMPRSQYESMPNWKKIELKKKVGLF